MSFGMIFPGQGSQSVGMLSALGARYPAVRATFDEASQVLGYDLWALVQSGPEEELARTRHTQPALLAAGVAVWRVWNEDGGPPPAVLAGHSLGEYTALVCAGALAYPEAILLVARRGEFMQEAVPAGEGAMAAILGLDDAAVRQVCAGVAGEETVQPVNFNAPGQVVIAGHRGAVERAVAAAKRAGARRAVPLAVSVPAHCALMESAAGRLEEALRQARIEPPQTPVVHNVDADTHSDPAEIRDVLVRQLYNPVLWVDTVRALVRLGVETIIEAGPGKVLTGLGRRIERSVPTLGVYDPDTLASGLAAVAERG